MMENTAEMEQNEAKPRKKRGFWGWTVIIIRSLFILLFTVILLGGLYFKAPWKILVLDGLLLALLTVVPKKKRKYGWLALAAAALAVTVWIFIPEKDTGNWRPYTFDEEIKAYHAKYAVPDEDNAAVILEEISLKYDDTFYKWPDLSNIEKPDDPNVFVETIMKQIQARCADFYPEFWTDELDKLTLHKPWKSKDYPKLAEWLKKNNDDINSLIEASKKPKCQFEYTFDPFPCSSFNDDPSYAIYEWLELLRRAANNDCADGRTGKAIEKYNAIFKLSDLLSQQPLWSLAMQGMRQYRDVHKPLSRFIINDALNDKQLNSLEVTINHIEEPDFESLFERWFEYQRLSMKQLWAGMYEVNEHGEFRNARSVPDNFLKHSFKEETVNHRFKEKKQKLSDLFSWFLIPTTPQAMAEQIDDAYDRISNLSPEEMKAEIDNYRLQLNFQVFAVGLMPSQLKSYHAIYKRKDFVNLHRKVYELYIALRRHKNKYGCWPDGLDQLKEFATEDVFIDPMNGDSFVYRNKEDNFVLYSKGKNGIDSQGIYERPVYDPNIMTKDEYYKLEPELDDIKLWPIQLGDNE